MNTKKVQEGLARWRAEGGKAKHIAVRPHINRTKAIWTFCLDCAGATHDAVLCSIGNCSLWEWRFGSHYSSPANQCRATAAWKCHPAAVKELKELGIDLDFYLKSTYAERVLFVERSLSGNLLLQDNVMIAPWRTPGPLAQPLNTQEPL